MSKIIYAVLRQGTNQDIDALKHKIALGASRISPDNNVRPTRVLSHGRVVMAILNPSASILTNTVSVCAGQVAADSRWSEVDGDRPEGTYAICRSNGDMVELLSDAVGSRTLWYYIDNSMFVASTSQRWITTVIGKFLPNPRVLGWMLTTGTLGPTEGWNDRLERLQADSILSLDLATWRTDLKRRDAVFRLVTHDRTQNIEAFSESLRTAFQQLDFDYSKWVLPLSGGYDSRAILCLLRDTKGLRTITWGVESSLRDPSSDAAIATRLANSKDVAHEYFHTDSSDETLAAVFEKFVAYGEGRTDRISGYMDGFAIWKTLLDRGIEGVIRGDEGFGWKEVRSDDEARKSVGLLLWSDFCNLPDMEDSDLLQQEIPDFLQKRHDETPDQWRDRLYHQFRAPTTLAALTDLKVSFVEIANPLLTHSIIASVRTLPDDLRTEKCLFRSIVDEVGPRIPYATSRSIADQKSILRTSEASEILSQVLMSDTARTIFPEALVTLVQQGMSRQPREARYTVAAGMKRHLRRIIPGQVRSAVARPKRKTVMDFNEMAFRIYITCKTYELLRGDARAGESANFS